LYGVKYLYTERLIVIW